MIHSHTLKFNVFCSQPAPPGDKCLPSIAVPHPKATGDIFRGCAEETRAKRVGSVLALRTFTQALILHEGTSRALLHKASLCTLLRSVKNDPAAETPAGPSHSRPPELLSLSPDIDTELCRARPDFTPFLQKLAFDWARPGRREAA